MSIATVVTRGYGSFGSVNLLPTIGYAMATIDNSSGGNPYTTIAEPAHYTLRRKQAHYTVSNRGMEYTMKGPVR